LRCTSNEDGFTTVFAAFNLLTHKFVEFVGEPTFYAPYRTDHKQDGSNGYYPQPKGLFQHPLGQGLVGDSEDFSLAVHACEERKRVPT
jgi:hypothetical protein